MKGFLYRVWRVGRWPLAVAALLYIGLVLFRIPAVIEQERTTEAVANIHATRLATADVTGERLPPKPDQRENDATLEGIDANGNGIRDDVEHAIFEKYATSTRERAAALQYALELQMEFTEAFNSETLVAVIQEQDRGSMCISEWGKIEEIDGFVFNTPARREFQQELYRKYMTSYALPDSDYCDIDPASLAN